MEYLRVDWRIILKWISRNRNLINAAQNTDKWRDFVQRVMNFLFSIKCGKLLHWQRNCQLLRNDSVILEM